MPNWCRNNITIRGDAGQRQALLSKVQQDYDEDKLEIRTDGFEIYENADYSMIYIMSANTPPMKFVEDLSEGHPELRFTISYYEPGWAFCGFAEVAGGISYKEEFDIGCFKEQEPLYNNVQNQHGERAVAGWDMVYADECECEACLAEKVEG